jgi:hypothetical protein
MMFSLKLKCVAEVRSSHRHFKQRLARGDLPTSRISIKTK